MPHWKKLMDEKEMLYAYDLDGRDVTLTITHVTGGELTGDQGRKTKKPIAHIKGKSKKLALNTTNCTTIEQLTGTSDYAKWKDVRVTLFPTTTNFGGKTVECIRIRPYPPKEKGDSKAGRDTKPDVAAQIADEMAKGDAPPPSGSTVPRDTEEDDDVPDEDVPNG